MTIPPSEPTSAAERDLADRFARLDDGDDAGDGVGLDAPPEPAPLDAASAGRLARALETADWLRRALRPEQEPAGGASFGRFEIVRELGRGGHGVVFLARDATLGRLVALKVPRPAVLDSAELRRRFRREARAVARLDHPGIVPVFEMSEAGPVCYIASAFVEGPTLAAWATGPDRPSPAALARLLARVADAVDHAHGRGVVHRDLKPENILVERPADGGEPLPRVTDFGLAKLLEPDDGATAAGLALGTPAYMAPEQRGGDPAAVGPAADVYALGVILRRFLPEGRRAAAYAPLLRVALDPDPARRYGSAAALADDLRRVADGRRPRLRSRRRAAARWAALGLVVAAAIVAGAFGPGAATTAAAPSPPGSDARTPCSATAEPTRRRPRLPP